MQCTDIPNLSSFVVCPCGKQNTNKQNTNRNRNRNKRRDGHLNISPDQKGVFVFSVLSLLCSNNLAVLTTATKWMHRRLVT